MTVEMIVDGLLKIFVGLIILLVYLRLTHRSQAGHQTPIDTIGNFVIGGVFGGVLYSKQISLFYFVIYMVFTLCMIQLLNVATTKIRFLHMAVREQRVPVITDGDIDIKSFQQADVVLDPMRLIADLRAQGIYDLEDIEFAQIEPNGALSVIRKGDGVPNFALIVRVAWSLAISRMRTRPRIGCTYSCVPLRSSLRMSSSWSSRTVTAF